MLKLNRKLIGIALCVIAVVMLGYFFISDEIKAVNGGAKVIPIYCVENKENKVAITFDCAWGADDIPVILNILKENDVKATFFLVGEWVKRNPEETKMIAEQGHDVANHSENHFKMSALNREKIKTEITSCTKTIEEITGQTPNLFRAPYGDYNDSVISIARQAGYYTIQWSIDSLDWKPGISREAILQRISNAKSGDIILFHNDTPHTEKILGDVIHILRQKDLTPVPVSELILKENYEIQHDGRQVPEK
ncbi:MAG: polysaccharide deacetylase family protein [Clostridiaceae bacterium]|jgi:polysaccharide deacetylase family sporulation protein PdaB|nr:polysaccharide deacetylase family protein [Clostridiaceae bacterium]